MKGRTAMENTYSIKWIVLDMDGTLLNSRDQISLRTKTALMICQKKGIRLILASGRSYPRLMPYAKELAMDRYGGRLIEVNGMAVYDLAKEERKIIRRLKGGQIGELFEFCKSCQVEVQCYQDKAIYYWIPQWQIAFKEAERKARGLPPDYPDLGGSWTWITDTRGGYPLQIRIGDVSQVPDELNKINCCADPETNEGAYRKLKDHFGSKYEIVRTCPRLIEISPKGVTKGNTLKMLMAEDGVKPSEVCAFGDGENDVEMFEAVGTAIAMGNAADYVKQHARYVTGTNQEDGIAMALEKWLIR